MVDSRFQTAEIINDLLNNNICKLCSLRYINEKNQDSYNNVDNYMKKLFDEGIHDGAYVPQVKQKKLNPCSACLGLLQLSRNEEFLEKIIKNVSAAGYDSDDVTFALSLPITILLRDHSVWLYISNKYVEFFNDSFDSCSLNKLNSVVSVKEVWKWTAAQEIADKINKKVNNGVNGNFHVNVSIDYEKDTSETSCLIDMFPEIFKCRSSQKRKFHGEILTRKSVENALLEVDVDFFKTYYSVPPGIPDCFVKCGNIDCVQDSVYLAGRYNKFSRNLSQTPWLINGERRMESSVEEIIAGPIGNVIEHSGIKFSSSGREDVDVRTLGKGRPFVLEITNPRRVKLSNELIKQIENDINSSTDDVFVRDLQIVQKEDLSHIKMGEQSKTKTYNCFCVMKLQENENANDFRNTLENLSNIKNLVIQQKTPIRVLHRRSLTVRPRTVFWLKADFHEIKGNQVFFKLALQVDAGTYIKEFVHGDFGRTKPNLSEILKRETDILALDVEEVALQWPPSLDENALGEK